VADPKTEVARIDLLARAAAASASPLDAVALLASCVYEQSFRAVDTALADRDPWRGETILRPTARVLHRVGRQLFHWAAQFHAIEPSSLPMMRNRIAKFADRDGRRLAYQLPAQLAAQPTGTDPLPDFIDEASEDRDERDALALDPIEPHKEVRVFALKPPTGCTTCGAAMRYANGKYGRYMRCSKEPTKHKPADGWRLGISCPEPGCEGELIAKHITDKTLGDLQPMVGCTRFPDCAYGVWEDVEHVACHRCALPFRFVEGDGTRRCINPRCVPSKNEVAEQLLALAVRACGIEQGAAVTLAITAGILTGSHGYNSATVMEAFKIGLAEGQHSRIERNQ